MTDAPERSADTPRGKGVFLRLAWSTYWSARRPWSFDGVPMPYIGRRARRDGTARMMTLGPLAVIVVDTRKEMKQGTRNDND